MQEIDKREATANAATMSGEARGGGEGWFLGSPMCPTDNKKCMLGAMNSKRK